jgi:hypothetical protein
MCVGKNVTLQLDNIQIVQGYMNRTRRNFSQTLNIIISEWDNFSIEINKIRANLQSDELKKAEVVKK